MTAGEARRGADVRALFKEEPLKTVCSWCTKTITPGKLPISHGICPTCSATVFPMEQKHG